MPRRNERPFRYEWESVMRRLALPSPTKLVAAYCAQYGNLDGTEIRPGVDRLKLETCLGERTVREALATLRHIGLLVRVRCGSKMGRRALTDVYKLAIPEDVADKVAEWNVRANRGQLGLVDDGTGADLTRGARSPRGTAAPHAGDSMRENPSNSDTACEEQRHPVPVITKNTGRRLHGTPAGGAPHQTSDHTSITPTTNTLVTQEQPLTSRARDAEEDSISPPADLATRPRCPHGRSARRNKDGNLRCPECRLIEEHPPPKPAECSHGVNSRYRCPACARGLTGERP